VSGVESNWICPRCGCRTQHFSVSREKYICDACGFTVQSENDRRKQEQYTRAIVQAKKHLQVGNWDSCSSIIMPMLNEYPTDSLLYLMLLASLTKGYDDYLLDDDVNRRVEASAVWDKLERLNSVNMAMRRYANSRLVARHDMLNTRVSTAGILAAGIIVGFLVSGALSSGLLLMVVSVCGFFAVKRISKMKPFSALRELSQKHDSNPFR
jgi:ribosomal protein L37E/tetrahydromethanopterin S-methyltransferase subunit F